MRQLEKALRDLTERAEPLPLDVLVSRVEAQLALEGALRAESGHEGPSETIAFERRGATMQFPTQQQPTRLRRRNVWAFAVAFVLIIAAVGIAALALRGDTGPAADEPARPTTEEPIGIDSLSWSRISLGTAGPRVHIAMHGICTPTSSLARGEPGLVAVGLSSDNNQPTVWISPDGYEWSPVPSENDTSGSHGPNDFVAGIAAHDDLLVIVEQETAWTSPDGITWSQVPPGTFRHNVEELRGVIAGGPGFVAFGGAIWTSPDGHTWTRVPDDPDVLTVDIAAMTIGGPGLVALGASHEDCMPVVLTSSDGYSWTRLPPDPSVFGNDPTCGLGGPGEMRIRGVATGGRGLVAVGSYMEQASAWTSPDGIAWTRVPDDPAVFDVLPHGEYSEMTSLAAVGDGLVAVGRRGGKAAVWTSHNGFTWTDISDDLDLSGSPSMIQVIEGGPGVVIFGVNQIESVIWVGNPSQPTE
jgi:hypothetical protein